MSAAAARLLTPVRLAQGRAAVGTALLATPRSLPRLLETAQPSRSTWAVQMLGARELALGAGTWLALRRAAQAGDPRPARLWLAAGVLSDAVDALVAARGVGAGDLRAVPGAGLVVVASTAVAAQVAALAENSRLLPDAPT